jgi:hypothetical protein
MLVVMHDTSRISLYESPMMHYLAVQGVDTQREVLQSAFYYTTILAGMLWINRLIMLEVAVPLEAWPVLGLKSKAEVESVQDRIHELRKKHLCEGSFSPTASILSQLAMGKKFNKTHQSQPNIHWSSDEQTVYYQGRGVAMGKIKSMCHILIQELQEALQELTFGTVPSIDLGGIVDSMAWSAAFRRQNYSFIEHVANREQVGVGYGFLLERARKGVADRQWQWRLLRKTKVRRQGQGQSQSQGQSQGQSRSQGRSQSQSQGQSRSQSRSRSQSQSQGQSRSQSRSRSRSQSQSRSQSRSQSQTASQTASHTTNQQIQWVDAQVKKYLTKERQFLRKLMVCMHITGK